MGRQQLGLSGSCSRQTPVRLSSPYLGTALLTSSEEGPRKGGLKIAHSAYTWTGYRTCRVIPLLRSKQKKQIKPQTGIMEYKNPPGLLWQI